MEPVTFTTEDGVRLEGEVRDPDDAPRGGAAILHAHPRHGGSKDHPLLWAIRTELAAARGCTVLGFNFRGIMGSQGSYGGGRDELRDARAAVAWIRDRAGEDRPTIVVGWSFGASVALRAALDDRRIDGLALIGLPLRPGDLSLPKLPDPAELRAIRRPVLLLAGEHDVYCPSEDIASYGAAFPDATVTVLPGTDHFFWRREKEAAAAVGELADRVLTS
jgi:alpha/beta superfamily hydrolase